MVKLLTRNYLNICHCPVRLARLSKFPVQRNFFPSFSSIPSKSYKRIAEELSNRTCFKWLLLYIFIFLLLLYSFSMDHSNVPYDTSVSVTKVFICCCFCGNGGGWMLTVMLLHCCSCDQWSTIAIEILKWIANFCDMLHGRDCLSLSIGMSYRKVCNIIFAKVNKKHWIKKN